MAATSAISGWGMIRIQAVLCWYSYLVYTSSGKHLQRIRVYITFFHGKTHELSMAMFNGYVKLPEGILIMKLLVIASTLDGSMRDHVRIQHGLLDNHQSSQHVFPLSQQRGSQMCKRGWGLKTGCLSEKILPHVTTRG